MSVSIVLENVAKKLGEGPHWVKSSGQLLFVDISSGDIHTLDTKTNKHEVVHVDGSVSFVIPATQGGYVVGNDQRIVHIQSDGSNLKTLGEMDNKGTKFNDGKCDASGRLWAGSLSIPGSVSPQEAQGAGSLYSLDKTQGFRKHQDGFTISNGLAWTKDNATMFFADSIPGKIYAFDYDIANGSISRQRIAVDISELGQDMGLPDGMTIDTEDKLWLACFNASKVVQIDPITAKVLREVRFPAKQITSCCFGGPDLSDLYVTSALYNLTEEEVRTNQPKAGSLFKVTGLGVKGLPANNYQS